MGAARRAAERAAPRALAAPETARCTVPSGRIASRERLVDTPAFAIEPSGRVYVPPGRYRLSLYRSDDAARERESVAWSGPQQVVVLTPGGTRADAGAPLGIERHLPMGSDTVRRMSTVSATSHSLRLLVCLNCGAPFETAPSGGHHTCTYCRATHELKPRDERPETCAREAGARAEAVGHRSRGASRCSASR
ncbi:MAG: hypothetical protein IPI43_13220 [Sandaracinaceae bacterium]|nr:hypothetical protein [Sandaracinaceae bacterium]